MREPPASPDNGSVISVRSSTKQFGDRTAAPDLSFEVAPGVVAGVLGQDGSGRSTTMRERVVRALQLDGHTDLHVCTHGRRI